MEINTIHFENNLILRDDLRLGNTLGLVSSNAVEDVEEQAINMTAWQQEYDQISAGRFSGELTEIWLEGVQFFIEGNNQALRQSCTVWPGAFWFGIPSPFSEGGFINEYPFEPGNMLIQPGGQEFELITPSDHEILGIVIEIPLLTKYFEAHNCLTLMPLLSSNPVWKIPPSYLHSFWKKLSYTLYQTKHLSNASALQLSHTACLLMLDELLSSLIDILQTAQLQNTPKSKIVRHRQVVHSIRNYILSRQDEIITVTQLCEAFHMSRRTLQNCFHEVLGVCPVTYLKAIRLNAVRRTLKKTNNTMTIQDVACNYGFWHMSQFAADYRRLFGEKPSETRLLYI